MPQALRSQAQLVDWCFVLPEFRRVTFTQRVFHRSISNPGVFIGGYATSGHVPTGEHFLHNRLSAELPNPPSAGLMGAMDDSDHNTRSNVPAVVAARPAITTRRAAQRLTRWDSGSLTDRLRRGSQHPAVIGSLATAAGLLLHAGLRWALTSPSESAGFAGSAIIPTPSTVTPVESIVQFSRTVVVETWTVRSRRI